MFVGVSPRNPNPFGLVCRSPRPIGRPDRQEQAGSSPCGGDGIPRRPRFPYLAGVNRRERGLPSQRPCEHGGGGPGRWRPPLHGGRSDREVGSDRIPDGLDQRRRPGSARPCGRSCPFPVESASPRAYVTACVPRRRRGGHPRVRSGLGRNHFHGGFTGRTDPDREAAIGNSRGGSNRPHGGYGGGAPPPAPPLPFSPWGAAFDPPCPPPTERPPPPPPRK